MYRKQNGRVNDSWMVLLALLISSLLLVCSGCSAVQSEEQPAAEEQPVVRLAYVDWASEIASAHVVKAVIEKHIGLPCELLEVTALSMWESVAAGDQDAMVAAWLPTLQDHYYLQVADRVELLGPNLEGVSMGLVVPAYVPLERIEELADHIDEFDGRIIGIDPEAGLTESTRQAMELYGLDEFELVTGSDMTMTSALEIAINEHRWVVVTGWTPHWKFARWDLKYLDDPEKVFGESEYIGTVVRQGLSVDLPEVYHFLNNFYWSAEDMNQVMYWFTHESMSPADAASRWINENENLVMQWLPD